MPALSIGLQQLLYKLVVGLHAQPSCTGVGAETLLVIEPSVCRFMSKSLFNKYPCAAQHLLCMIFIAGQGDAIDVLSVAGPSEPCVLCCITVLAGEEERLPMHVWQLRMFAAACRLHGSEC